MLHYFAQWKANDLDGNLESDGSQKGLAYPTLHIHLRFILIVMDAFPTSYYKAENKQPVLLISPELHSMQEENKRRRERRLFNLLDVQMSPLAKRL